jgi:plasmid stabilization system protein ParE
MILRYHEKAREEIIETTNHYGEVRPELGAEFLAELGTAIDAILDNPLICEQVRPGIRCYLMDRFPYGIYYRLPDNNTVHIIVVRNHSRRPSYGMRRK